MHKHWFTLILLAILTFLVSSPWAKSQEEVRVPAYEPAPTAKSADQPPLLGKDQLWGGNMQPNQTHAYELAATIPALLHQEPCYCYCDRGMGHKSLHSCFEGTHGAQCSTCLKELYYTYTQHKQGKSAAQIRQGIIKGEWKQVDLQAAATIQ